MCSVPIDQLWAHVSTDKACDGPRAPGSQDDAFVSCMDSRVIEEECIGFVDTQETRAVAGHHLHNWCFIEGGVLHFSSLTWFSVIVDCDKDPNNPHESIDLLPRSVRHSNGEPHVLLIVSSTCFLLSDSVIGWTRYLPNTFPIMSLMLDG